MVPRQHKQQRKSQRWGGFCFSGEQTLSLLPYNATPVSAWSPSQQVLAISSDQFVNFLVCLHSQAFTNSRLLGSGFKLNSPALLSSVWRRALSQSQELWLQAGCQKFTYESQGQLTNASSSWLRHPTPPAAARLKQALYFLRKELHYDFINLNKRGYQCCQKK